MINFSKTTWHSGMQRLISILAQLYTDNLNIAGSTKYHTALITNNIAKLSKCGNIIKFNVSKNKNKMAIKFNKKKYIESSYKYSLYHKS